MTPIWTLTVGNLHFRCVPDMSRRCNFLIQSRLNDLTTAHDWKDWGGGDDPRVLLDSVVTGKLVRAKLAEERR